MEQKIVVLSIFMNTRKGLEKILSDINSFHLNGRKQACNDSGCITWEYGLSYKEFGYLYLFKIGNDNMAVIVEKPVPELFLKFANYVRLQDL